MNEIAALSPGGFSGVLSAVVCSATLAYIITPLVISIAIRYGWFDQPDARRIHVVPTPRLGGLAVAVSFLLVALPILTLSVSRSDHLTPSVIGTGAFIASYVSIVVVGFYDDIRGIRPIVKLAFQMIASIAVVAALPREATLFGIDFPPLLVATMHVGWFLVLINAFNLIDGFDGLATPLAAVSMLGLLGFLILKGEWGHSVLLAAYIGALIGFYPYNRYPARVFLGDCGSMGIGFMFAFSAISGGAKSGSLSAAFIPLFAAAVPILDLVLAVWRRLARRLVAKIQSRPAALGMMIGDLEHLHHRLLSRNLRPQDVAAVLIFINAAVVLIGLVSLHLGHLGAIAAPLALTAFMLLLMVGLPKPELYETGRLLYEILCEMRSRILAAGSFLICDLLMLGGAWLAQLLLLEGSLRGVLSVEEGRTFLLFASLTLTSVVFLDLLVGRERPKLCLLITGVVIFILGLFHSPLKGAITLAVLSVLPLFFARRSLATLQKIYNPTIIFAPVTFYGRLRRSSVE